MEKRKPSIAVAKPAPPVPQLTEQEIDEILFPELSRDQFNLNGKDYRIRVLPWKWEKSFRYAVMPIVEHEFKPFEQIIYAFATELHFVKEDLKFTEAIIDTERKVDAYLTQAVAIMCVSQDEETLRRAANGEEMPIDIQANLEKKYHILIENAPDLAPSPRVYLREIVRRQMVKHEMVQRLGESLMARLDEFARLSGQKKTFDSLKQTFKLQVQNYMASVGNRVSILDNSFTPPTDSSSETSSTPMTSEPAPVIEESAVPEAPEKSMEAVASGQTSE